jgi:hypothetical protein
MDKYFEILGLKPGASQKEIKAAYRDLAQVWHPDKYSHNPRLKEKAEAKLREIIDAYKRLKVNQYTYTPQSESTESTYQKEREHQPVEAEEDIDDSAFTSRHDDSERFSSFNYETNNRATLIPKIVAGLAALFLVSVIAFVIYSAQQGRDKTSETATNTTLTNSAQINNSNYDLAVNGNTSNIAKNYPRSNTKLDAELGLNTEYEVPDQATTSIPENPETLNITTMPASSPESIARNNDSPLTYASPPQGYFTIGSGKEDVLAVQGTPDRIIGSSFSYGYSSISFQNNRVSGWSNISKNLRVRMISTSSRSENYFTLGSTKDDVVKVQGTPDSIIGNSYGYGYSSISFQGNNVVGWSNISKNLKVKLFSNSENSLSQFTVGSSKDDVIKVQGTPDSIIGNTFGYGYSSVHFQNNRVTNWSNISGNLRVILRPAQ